MTLDIQALFAERIGGSQFGRVVKVFKFTLIDNAKRAFMADNPGVSVIDMGVGEPEERAPEQIANRLHKEALKLENRIYPNNGTVDFKAAAARYLARLLDQEFNPESEIVHCIGAKTALAQLPLAFVNPGDAVISTAPGYPVMPTVVDWLGGRNVKLPLTASNKFLPDLSELKQAIEQYRPKLLLLNYPNNPTGAIADSQFYRRVIELAHQHNFVIVQDAAYADYTFAGPYVSPLQLPGGRDVTIEVYSLSKGYNMQGYRLGFVVSNPALLKAFAVVKDNTDNGQFIATQLAGCEALDNCPHVLDGNRHKYQRRLERSAEILSSVGIVATRSAGTFYQYVAVPKEFHSRRFDSAQEFSNYLIRELGIVTVPWDDSGAFVRLSMTFEIAAQGFRDEEHLFQTLQARLRSGQISC